MNDINLYKVPEDGYYKVSKIVLRAFLTGNTIKVKNEKSKWYKFWIPSKVETDEVLIIPTYLNEEERYLTKGQFVESKSLFKIDKELTFEVPPFQWEKRGSTSGKTN